MKVNLKLAVSCISICAFSNCTSVHTLNQFNEKGYTFILNDKDTLKFDELYLDEAYEHQFIVDKNSQTIRLNTGLDSLKQILSIKGIEKLYKSDSTKIAFIVFGGEIFGSSISDEKIFIQRSLIKDYDRSKNTFGCRNQGDVIIIK